ncbi:lipopolysaccharide heptosyltransferase family protein [Candidatus Pelagibacter sp.]|nr:lipopolysaccharide heptosyltransferase family protein [Candidatus Pelagibacter sp.]
MKSKSNLLNNICVVYTHHKLGDLIWQLPYMKAISDHHRVNIDLVVRESTQAKKILQDLKHIKIINYNNFRKGIFYWIDVVKLIKIFKKNNYSHVYILDKVNKPALAAKLSGIKNIIGPGIGNQKKWLSSRKFLDESDWKLNYSEQSKKLLKINNIKLNDPLPKLDINIKNLQEENKDLLISGKKIAFGVDSFEDYKMWYEENFVELADLLYKKNFFNYVYLICGPKKSYIAKKIISLSRKDYFIDCSSKDLTGVITAIVNSNFYIGNNSGPLNLSSALGIKTFGLIVNDAISELKYSKINFIVPDNYKDNTWIRKRENMRTLTTQKVYDAIIERINR